MGGAKVCSSWQNTDAWQIEKHPSVVEPSQICSDFKIKFTEPTEGRLRAKRR